MIEDAEALMATGDYAAAIAKCREALDAPDIDADPEAELRRGAWTVIAASHVRTGQFEEADEAAKHAHEGFQATYAETKALWQAFFQGGAGDLMADVLEAESRGDWDAAVAAAEKALYVKGLDDDLRDDLYAHLAMAYLWLDDWGRAEEYAQIMKQSRREEYERFRWERMEIVRDVKPEDLPFYDGSAYDDVVADGKAKFEAKDYRGALDAFKPISTATIDRGAFGMEVYLYVALCYLYLGEQNRADYYATDLTGAWLDSYKEHQAAVGSAR